MATAPVQAPIRARITAAFAVVMLLLLAAIAVLAYRAMGSALADEIDTGLRFRAVSALQAPPTARVLGPDRRLQEPTEAFQQLLARDGAVRSATRGFARPLLDRTELSAIRAPTLLTRQVAGVAGSARLLAVPVRGTDDVLVVGASTSDRTDALHQLIEVLAIGGPVAIGIACLAAWAVAGWLLSPVERMRAQAAAITASGLDHHLPVPRARDELHRLAQTLNQMLDRLARSVAAERGFLERAGHELRTPLAALRAEVDLALRHGRTREELVDALQSVSQETDRLARLADDLLVLARATDGRLPLRREPTNVHELLTSSAELFAGQAEDRAVTITVTGAAATADVDPLRIRQVLHNLLANALRHTPAGGTIGLHAVTSDDQLTMSVADSGPGFDALALNGSGLGLRIVTAIIESHGGTVSIGRGATGTTVVKIAIPCRDS